MYARVESAVVSGPAVQRVTLEFEATHRGLPGLTIVGLPRASVLESRERVFSALRSCGVALPRARVTVNLRPVDIPKSGSSLDLPLALGLLLLHRLIPPFSYGVVGELGLDGSLRATPGQLALIDVLMPYGVVFPAMPLNTFQIFPDTSLLFAQAHLEEILTTLRGESCFLPVAPSAIQRYQEGIIEEECTLEPQVLAALELAMAGGHHLLVYGPPGIGKTHIRTLLPSVLPALQEAEYRQKVIARSLEQAGPPLQFDRIVSPHHTATVAGLLGGGVPLRPGAVTQAHNGILFLDEFPEFSREALESLRQPLEDERVSLVRGSQSWVFPSAFTLLATANPCPCGFWGEARCHCTTAAVQAYTRKISGPVLDRIDLQVRLFGREQQVLRRSELEVIRGRIESARALQRERAKKGFPALNRQYRWGDCRRLGLHPPGELLPEKWRFRRRLKWARVVQTLADLAGREVRASDWSQALEWVSGGFGEL